LLVAARERASRERRIGRPDVVFDDAPARVFGDGVAVENTVVRVVVLLPENKVLGHRVIEDQPATVAVLRDVREPGLTPVVYAAVRDVRAAECDGPARDAANSGDGLEQFGLAVSLDAGDSEDLAGCDAERDIVHRLLDPGAAHHEVAHVESGGARRARQLPRAPSLAHRRG